MVVYQVRNLVGPCGRRSAGLVAKRHVHPCPCGAKFVDARQFFGLLHAALEFEHDGRSISEYQSVANRIVQAPDLHI